jgi:carbonic anhydrase
LFSATNLWPRPKQIAEAYGAVAKQLQEPEPILAERVQSGKIKIVAARYDLDTGKIHLVIR